MKNLFKQKKHTTDQALLSLLKVLNIKVAKTNAITCLHNHPDYPSILSISSCLNDWQVKNAVYHIDKSEYQDGLLFPFVAHFPENGGRFILVSSINDKGINYADELVKNGLMPEEEFLKRWDGIALHAEPNSESGDKRYASHRFEELLRSFLTPFAIIAFSIFLYTILPMHKLSWTFSALAFLKAAGIGVSVLLLMQSLNANNPFIKNLCTLNGKNDCNAILKSEAAKVASWLSWSEVGFFYFTGSFLALLVDPTSLPILALFNLLALPYTIYSITYQYRNKNWCILCCSVQVILALEALCFVFGEQLKFSIPVISLATLVSFMIPVIAWAFLKPFFTKAAQINSLKGQLKKFKYNTELFQQALKNQPRYAVPDDLMPIVLGNPNGETIITMVSNPFCEPCAKAHENLCNWLKSRNDIKLKIIFTTADREDDEKTKVSRHASELSKLNDIDLLDSALNDWYNQSVKKYEIWAKKYPISLERDTKLVTEKQKEWCVLTEIKVTPTILINGYKIPAPYQLDDIKYLLD